MAKRKLVIGDIHGAYRALLQVLERAHFNSDEDALFCTGDIVDGSPETMECIEFLMSLPHFASVIGNHDMWFQQFLEDHTYQPESWRVQGGNASMLSFTNWLNRDHNNSGKIPAIAQWFKKMPYVIFVDDYIIVHAGIPHATAEELQEAARSPRRDEDTSSFVYVWDRTRFFSEFAQAVHEDVSSLPPHTTLVMGHTPVQILGPTHTIPLWSPHHRCVAMDTGCRFGERLSLMDLHSHQIWQSDPARLLYEHA